MEKQNATMKRWEKLYDEAGKSFRPLTEEEKKEILEAVRASNRRRKISEGYTMEIEFEASEKLNKFFNPNYSRLTRDF